MTSKRPTRATQKRGNRYSRGPTRNITRWSANKDIALLCALTKECRKDKFRVSWDRVAKWVGPNVTGGAIEQHVAKLYAKLKDYRKSHRNPPPRKKRKAGETLPAEDDEDDYLEDEEMWNKGNEAFANIFYDKPDSSSMLLEPDGDEDSDEDDSALVLRRKQPRLDYDDLDEYEQEDEQDLAAQYSYPTAGLAPQYPAQALAYDEDGNMISYQGQLSIGSASPTKSMIVPPSSRSSQLRQSRAGSMAPSVTSSMVPPGTARLGTPNQMRNNGMGWHLNQPHFHHAGQYGAIPMQQAGYHYPQDQQMAGGYYGQGVPQFHDPATGPMIHAPIVPFQQGMSLHGSRSGTPRTGTGHSPNNGSPAMIAHGVSGDNSNVKIKVEGEAMENFNVVKREEDVDLTSTGEINHFDNAYFPATTQSGQQRSGDYS